MPEVKIGKLDFVDLKSFAAGDSVPLGDWLFFAKHFCPYVFIRPICTHKTILEIGLGLGYGLKYLSGAAGLAAGIDLGLDNCRQAQAQYGLDNMLAMNGLTLGFQENSFDLIYCFQVIEHIRPDKVAAFLREIKRVLKKDGVFVCSTLNIEHHIKDPKTYQTYHEHEKEYNCKELEALLRKVFSRVAVYGLFRTRRHSFYLRLKKWGFLKYRLLGHNPVKRFYANASPADFRVGTHPLPKSIDFIAVCV